MLSPKHFLCHMSGSQNQFLAFILKVRVYSEKFSISKKVPHKILHKDVFIKNFYKPNQESRLNIVRKFHEGSVSALQRVTVFGKGVMREAFFERLYLLKRSFLKKNCSSEYCRAENSLRNAFTLVSIR